MIQGDAAHQVQGGAQAVVGEFEVLAGIPGCAGEVALVGRGCGGGWGHWYAPQLGGWRVGGVGVSIGGGGGGRNRAVSACVG